MDKKIQWNSKYISNYCLCTEVTHDITHLTKAKFLSHIGKKTPVFTRFSTVGGEKGSADTARDPRGFAVKFYTEEGKFCRLL